MDYELTSSQKNIWNVQKYYEDTTISSICGALFFEENFKEDVMQRALNLLIQEQSGLRLRMQIKNGEVRQEVQEYIPEVFPVHTFENKKAFEEFVQKESAIMFPLTNSKLYHFYNCRIHGKTAVFVILSHLIADGWTLSLVCSRISAYIRQILNNECFETEEQDYRRHIEDEIRYRNSEKYQKDQQFFESIYEEVPKQTRIKNGHSGIKTPASKRYERKLESRDAADIRSYCKTHQLTPTVIFEAAMLIYLQKMNPQNKVFTFGMPVLNRTKLYEKRCAGMFISTVPFAISFSDEMKIIDFLKLITMTHTKYFRHQQYPYHDILGNLRKKYGFGERLYDVMISYQNAQVSSEIPFTTKWYSNGYSEVPLEMHIDDRDRTGNFQLTFDYQKEVFPEESEVVLLCERIIWLLQQMIHSDGKSIAALSIMPPYEEHRILHDFHKFFTDRYASKCVHEIFMAQAERTPEAAAVIYEGKVYTYRQIDEMSNAIAHELKNRGITVNCVVPVIAHRSHYVIVAMLGVLKAGGAYLPIDPEYPKDRINYMISEAGADYILTYHDDAVYDNIQRIDLESFSYEDLSSVPSVNKKEDLCYVIFTSGSTGKPKGVTMHHRPLVNLIMRKQKIFLGENISSTTTISFDVFTQEVFTALLLGKTLYLSDDRLKENPRKFFDFIKQNKIHSMFCTPSYFNYVMSHIHPSDAGELKNIFFAGEALVLSDLCIEWLRKNQVCIINQYGPSETHVVTERIYEPVELAHMDVTIGKPIVNVQALILDEQMNLCPVGVDGELYIAGENVGKGYLNHPELTNERFKINPFYTEKDVPYMGKILYQTGDIARYRADGNIEYLGRIDTQVKIRGLRVELGEIENEMSAFEGITLAAATDKQDTKGRQYLVGYYLAEKDINEKELRQHLREKLPAYMVPHFFMRLESMPMTASGKIDRKNLPDPNMKLTDISYVEPETELQRRLCDLWEEAFEQADISIDADFFELGGDSLLALSLLAKIESVFHVRLSMKDIFENATIRLLAEKIQDNPTDNHIIPHKERESYILLPQQKAIYIEWLRNPSGLMYNMPAAVKIGTFVNRKKLISAIEQLLIRHKNLTVSIVQREDTLYGVYHDPMEVIIEEYTDQTMERFVRPFDLHQEPLVRFGFSEHYLLLDIHHILTDGHSFHVILKDLLALYEEKELPQINITYADYADFITQRIEENVFSYCMDYLKHEFPSDIAPITLPKPETLEKNILKDSFYEFTIDKHFKKNSQKLCWKYQITETMLYFAAYSLLLHYYSNEEELTSSIVLANRMYEQVMPLVGMFVNTVPCRLKAGNEETLAEYFSDIRQQIFRLYEYQELPFEVIAEQTGIETKNALNTCFVYQVNDMESLCLDGKEYPVTPFELYESKFDLTFEICTRGNDSVIRIEYRPAVVGKDTIQRMAESYQLILNSMLFADTTEQITYLSEMEKRKLVKDFNQTYVKEQENQRIWKIVRNHAVRTPNRTAIVFQDRKMTYRELEERVNALAALMIEKGITYKDAVGCMLNRDERVMIAQLAVMRIGAVFLPIDSRYPKQRVQYMIEDCDIQILIHHSDCQYTDLCKNHLNIDIDIPVFHETIGKTGMQEDTCYVIYTSGSTGQPKGCQLTNRGLLNFCKNNNILSYVDSLKEKIFVSVNTISFDYFIAESLLPLVNGYTVVLASEEESNSGDKLTALILKHHVNILATTPTRIKMYLKGHHAKEAFKNMDVIVSSGEALERSLLDEICDISDAKIYNPLGPSECSVWNLGGELKMDEEKINITLGKPIANTQIYVLNSKMQLCPLGVPGELCIAGAGVGNGYLNRPDITAERFIPNPFYDKKTNPSAGKILYRTGDLVRQTTDGNIEYLGRIDTQVKIRGLRVELGEIENEMSAFEDITLAAATDKQDTKGRQYLVGYYLAEKDINEKELRLHLREKLPAYMVPHFFMRLESMPMTASGKIDRKNLPLPDFGKTDRSYVEPTNDLQKKLCDIYAKTLGCEHYGITNDFFEMGGDSLSAIQILVSAEEAGMKLALQNIFDYPNIEVLSQMIEKGISEKNNWSKEQFTKYEPLLRNNRQIGQVPQKHPLGDVFLTGATGFLGIHILEKLLLEETGKIYCLVRGADHKEAENRLLDTMAYYFDHLYDNLIDDRIFVICGDITSDTISDELPVHVDMVIHAAASVKHYGEYRYFEKINVTGTNNVLAYAKQQHAKYLHISTVSVSGNSFADTMDIVKADKEIDFTEGDLYIEQPLENVYVRSKFMGELAVLDAMLEGLEANIIRIGNLTNRYTDFKFQKNYSENAFLNRMKACMEFGYIPEYLYDIYIEFSPVDMTADAILKIAQHMNETYTVFHVNSDKGLYFKPLVKMLHSMKIPMKVISGTEYAKKLHETLQHQEQKYIYEAFMNDMDENGNLQYDTKIHIKNDFTVAYLKQLGFEWNTVDERYLKGYLEYFRTLGYLEVQP